MTPTGRGTRSTPAALESEVLRRAAELAESIQHLRRAEAETTPEISFISPCYNEAENLEALAGRIQEMCRIEGIEQYEILLVENGSADGSDAIMRRLHDADSRIKMLQLSRNFGYQGAIACGLSYARGEWVSVLDGDLQDPPEFIPKLLAKAREGFDVVYGIREKRVASGLKKLAYYLFYRIWRMTSEIEVPLDAGDFCVMHRKIVDTIVSMPERQRFVRGLRAWSGFRQTGVPYERKGRAAGETKFPLRHMINLALDGLLSYSVMPLRFMSIAGAAIMSVSVLVSLVEAALRMADYLGWTRVQIFAPGFTQLNLLISFLVGFNILSLGIVGEYVGRIYNEVKQRPIFVVRSLLW